MAQGFLLDSASVAKLRRLIAQEVSRLRGAPKAKREPFRNERAPMRRFELLEALTAGGSAQAKFVFDDGEEEADGEDIELHDWLGVFEGAEGARGYCVYFADAGRWEVVQLECA